MRSLRKFRTLLVAAALAVATTPVVASCGMLFQGGSPQRTYYALDDFQAGMFFDGNITADATSYKLQDIIRAFYTHAQVNCKAQFAKLPEEQQTYAGYSQLFLQSNGIPLDEVTDRQHISIDNFNSIGKYRGFSVLGRAQSGANKASAGRGSDRQTAAAQRAQFTIVPDCRSCVSTQGLKISMTTPTSPQPTVQPSAPPNCPSCISTDEIRF